MVDFVKDNPSRQFKDRQNLKPKLHDLNAGSVHMMVVVFVIVLVALLELPPKTCCEFPPFLSIVRGGAAGGVTVGASEDGA